MITTRIKGGLGNQLFQYGISYALAKETDQDVEFDVSFFSEQKMRNFKLASLNVKYKDQCSAEGLPKPVKLLKNKYLNKVLRKLKWAIIPCGKGSLFLLEYDHAAYMPDLLKLRKDNIYIDGYYQCHGYFDKYREELLQQIRPAYEPEYEYLRMLSKVSNLQTVAVHVRRGDFVAEQKKASSYHYLLDKEYYARAKECIEKRIEKPEYYIFSDDPEWTRQIFGSDENTHFVALHTQYSDIDEMMLMKNCNHIITANSTFSWWAAWLNEHEDAIRIVPKKIYGPLGMIPDEWLQV